MVEERVNYFDIKVMHFKNTIAWLFEKYNNFFTARKLCFRSGYTHLPPK